MKKVIVTMIGLVFLAGCGGNSAEEDYKRCTKENSFGKECTRDEFEDFLFYEAEYNQLTPLSEMTETNQREEIQKINDKIDEIFE